jgi:hypothetical protein
MSDAQIVPPAGVPLPEANAASIDSAAAAFEKFLAPAERPRAPDGKFASTKAPSPEVAGEAPPAAESAPQPAEQLPDAAPTEEAEERFEVDLGDAGRVELSASELAAMVREAKQPKAAPSAVSEEVLRERAKLVAEQEAVSRERAAYAQRLAENIPTALSQLQQRFPEIKSMADLERLAVDDPARALQFRIAVDTIESARAEHAQLQNKLNAEQEARRDQYVSEQRKLLAKAVPEFADPVKGPEEKRALFTWLTNKGGFSEDELAQLVDHRTVLVARKAMLYDRMMEAKPEAKRVAPVLKVIRPGATRAAPAAPAAVQAREAAIKKLETDHSLGALTNALKSMGVR